MSELLQVLFYRTGHLPGEVRIVLSFEKRFDPGIEFFIGHALSQHLPEFCLVHMPVAVGVNYMFQIGPLRFFSVLLVLASTHYDPNEYIRNYDEFVKEIMKEK